MKANVIFAQVNNNEGFDYEHFEYETIKDNMSEIKTWEFDDKKKARRFLYKSIQQMRLKKGVGEAPEEMKFLLANNKFDLQNSQMEDKTTGNGWLQAQDKIYVLVCQEIKPEKPVKDETPAPETETPTDEVATSPENEVPAENPTEAVELPAPPAEIVIDPIAELFGEVGKEIETTKKTRKNKKH